VYNFQTGFNNFQDSAHLSSCIFAWTSLFLHSSKEPPLL